MAGGHLTEAVALTWACCIREPVRLSVGGRRGPAGYAVPLRMLRSPWRGIRPAPQQGVSEAALTNARGARSPAASALNPRDPLKRGLSQLLPRSPRGEARHELQFLAPRNRRVWRGWDQQWWIGTRRRDQGPQPIGGTRT